MPQYCCVPGCRGTGGHQFPKDLDLKLKWRVAIKRIDPSTKKLWIPNRLDVVCKTHFNSEDYRVGSLLDERKRLLPKAVPSVFLFRSVTKTRKPLNRSLIGDSSSVDEIPEVAAEEVYGLEESDDVLIEENNDLHSPEIDTKVREAEVQCSLLRDDSGKVSIYNFKNNPKAVHYYTGFYNYEYFMFFFNILGPAASDLNYKCPRLSPADQLFLTLIKLRQGYDDIGISLMFHISESSVSRLLGTWINFLYYQLSEINIWPSKKTVKDTMPTGFSNLYPSTRVILDATEIPIQKPAHVNAQSATYSTYKSRNTLKAIIGCSPRGLVTYVSDAYGGSASDRQIIERSDLILQDKMDKKDSIMADRGIMVQDLFANKDVMVNTPTMLKGKSQLSAEDVVKDRRVASKRVHVERVIGLGKTFKILKQTLSHSKLHLGSRIIFICYMLSNFKKSIVNRLA